MAIKNKEEKMEKTKIELAIKLQKRFLDECRENLELISNEKYGDPEEEIEEALKDIKEYIILTKLTIKILEKEIEEIDIRLMANKTKLTKLRAWNNWADSETCYTTTKTFDEIWDAVEAREEKWIWFIDGTTSCEVEVTPEELKTINIISKEELYEKL